LEFNALRCSGYWAHLDSIPLPAQFILAHLVIDLTLDNIPIETQEFSVDCQGCLSRREALVSTLSFNLCKKNNKRRCQISRVCVRRGAAYVADSVASYQHIIGDSVQPSTTTGHQEGRFISQAGTFADHGREYRPFREFVPNLKSITIAMGTKI